MSVKISIIHDFYLQSKGDYVGIGLKFLGQGVSSFLGGGRGGHIFGGSGGQYSILCHGNLYAMEIEIYDNLYTTYVYRLNITSTMKPFCCKKKKFLNLGEQIVATLHLSPFSNFCTRKYGAASLLLLFFLQQNNCMVSEK